MYLVFNQLIISILLLSMNRIPRQSEDTNEVPNDLLKEIFLN